jgi:hypothetical protein
MDLEKLTAQVGQQNRKKAIASLSQPQEPIAHPEGKVLHADLSPEAGASNAMAFVRSRGKAGTNPAERVGEILKQVEAVKAGDMSNPEAMLYSQALTLQTMFNDLVSVASALMPSCKAEEAIALFHVALKAQNQCRQTLLALNEVKNPKKPTQFIKNYVNQQLNQLKTESQPQLEEPHNAPMDFGSTAEAVRDDRTVEALDAIDRSHQPGGKTAKQSKRAQARTAIG